jgi:hypothetical protein
MTIILPSHDESIMPIKLGHVLRVPNEDWPSYGIRWNNPADFQRLVEWGRGEYMREWAQGDPSQVEIVAEASKRAFGGNDNNQLLRERTGEVVAKHLEMQAQSDKRVFYVLDVGAGSGDSFTTFLDKVSKDFKGEITAVLLDPAAKPLGKAAEKVAGRGVKYVTLDGRQDQIPELFAKHLGGKKMSAVLQVGSIHHDCKIPFQYFFDVLEDDGIFASGDWHPQTWQNPAYVLKMLETNWPEHEQAIAHFKKVYGVKNSSLPRNAKDRQACNDIFRFWKAYQDGLLDKGRDYGSNSIWPFESHQDFRRYIKKMKAAGFLTDGDVGYLGELLKETGTANPQSFYKDSTVIMGTYGHRLPILK